MSAPDFGRGFLRVPNAVWEALLCRAPVTRRQLQLLSVVTRETWGWQEPGGGVRPWTRPLRTRDFALRTGLSPDRIGRDLEALSSLGVLRRHGDRWQFVPAGLAECSRVAAASRRRAAMRRADGTAGTAEVPSGLKTAKTKKRNVTYDRSTGNRSSANCPRDRAGLFVRLVEAAAGPLPPETARQLRERVARDGVAAVWRELERAFPDPKRLRRRLEALLSEEDSGGSGEVENSGDAGPC